MSNVICTTVMCSQGKSSVQEMRRVFNILSGNPSFNKQKYESSVLAIEQSFEDQWTMFSEWIPFNPACCAIADLGTQANALTIQMQRAAGVETTPTPTPQGIDLDNLVMLGALALGATIIGNLRVR